MTAELSRLAFIDAACGRMILDAVRGVAGSRAVSLQTSPGSGRRDPDTGVEEPPVLDQVFDKDSLYALRAAVARRRRPARTTTARPLPSGIPRSGTSLPATGCG